MNGENDDAREGTPAFARPHVHILARGTIGAHTFADKCLRSRCAGDTPSINTAAAAVIVAAVAAVDVAPLPLPSLLVAAPIWARGPHPGRTARGHGSDRRQRV